MREVLLVAICLLALSVWAHASEVDCNGYRYGMRVRDVVTLNINDEKAPACIIPNNVSWDTQKWCNPDDFCTFRAHVVRRDGNKYVIDRIVGPVKWGD